jgi:hypothetical protein
MTRAPAAELESLLRDCEADLAAVAAARSRASELAAAVGGELELRWAIVDLRAALAAPPDDDSIRERYGELVDRHRDHPDRLERLRALGDEIRRLEDAGVLPSALVVRAPRRGPREP